MAFANADDSEVDDDNELEEAEEEEVADAEPTATDEAEVDWNADDEAAAWEEDNDEVAVVTMVGCPVFERNEELCNFDKSVLVLLAAVTSAASLPTRTVQGAEGDQCSTPKPICFVDKNSH